MKHRPEKYPGSKERRSRGKRKPRVQHREQAKPEVREQPLPYPAERNAFLLLKAVLSLLLIIQGIASFLPGPALWSLNHLAYAPSWVGPLWTVVGMCIIWLPGRPTLSHRIGRFLSDRVAPPVLERRMVAYVLLPLIGAVLFSFLRCKVYFLGDGWLHGEMVARGVRFHGFDFLTYHLVAKLFASLDQPVKADGFRMFVYVSVVSGVLYLVAAAWSARNLSNDGASRILLYCLLVFLGSTQVFMGYVECYSILTIFMLLFVASLIGHYLGRFPLWVPGVAFGLGLIFHLDALFVVPLIALPLFWPARYSPRSFAKRLASLAGPVAATLTVALAIYVAQGYNADAFRYDFIRWRATETLFVPLSGEHALLSWDHWKDVLNLLLLLVPVPVAMLVASFALRTERTKLSNRTQKMRNDGRETAAGGTEHRANERILALLLVANLCLLLLMSTLHMKQGIPRDWDLFAAHAPLLALTAWFAWSRVLRGRIREDLVGVTVATAILFSVPWFWLNAGETRSVQWFRDITPGFPSFQKAYAHEEIGKYFRNKRDISEALKEYEMSAESYPAHARFRAALGALQYSEGMKDEALKTFQEVLRTDPSQKVGLELTARIHHERGEYEAALPYARRLARTGKERPAAAILYGDAAEKLGLIDEALEAYERALPRESRNVELLCRIGRLYIAKNDFARAERAFESALRLQPTSVPGRVGLATAIWETFLRSRPSLSHPSTQTRLSLVRDILDGLIAEGRSDANTRAWRDKVLRTLRQGAPR